MSTPTALVQKLWNYSNPAAAGRDDGLSYGDLASQIRTCASRIVVVEQQV